MTGVFALCNAHSLSLSKQQMKGAKTKYRFPVNYELKFVLFFFVLMEDYFNGHFSNPWGGVGDESKSCEQHYINVL